MSTRGMIVQERTNEVLAAAMSAGLKALPRGTWVTAERLADASSGLRSCGEGRYEVVEIGVIVSADEVRSALLGATSRFQAEGVDVRYERGRGFAVFDLAG